MVLVKCQVPKNGINDEHHSVFSIIGVMFNFLARIRLCVFRFPDGKIHSVDTQQDALLLLRTIGNQKLNKLLMREYRPHLLVDTASFVANEQVNFPQSHHIFQF